MQEREDYDEAKALKKEIEVLRVKVRRRAAPRLAEGTVGRGGAE